MFWLPKRTVSLRRFFLVTKTYIFGLKNNKMYTHSYLRVVVIYNPILVYCRELAPGTVSLTCDRAQGDDSKHDSHYSLQSGLILCALI